MNEKLGIRVDTVKTDEFAAGFTPLLKLSEREKALLQESTLDIYDLFLDRVSKGRKLSLDSTKIIAQGRVWTGRAAQKIGLVDELGNLDQAIKIAAKKAGLEDFKTVEYPFIKEDFASTLLKEKQRSNNDEEVFSGMFSSKEERKLYDQYKQLKAIVKMKQPQTRLPYIFEWN
jgi:protease-4